MKKRIYLIAALAFINIVIMKYHELDNAKKVSTVTITEGQKFGIADTLVPGTK